MEVMLIIYLVYRTSHDNYIIITVKSLIAISREEGRGAGGGTWGVFRKANDVALRVYRIKMYRELYVKIGCVHVPWWGRSFSDSFYCYGNMDGKVNVSLRHFSCWQTKIWKKCICNCGFKDRRGPRSKMQSRAKIVSR